MAVTKKEKFIIIGLVLVVILFSIVGGMDYTDEQTAHNQYKSDVCEGIYPDYKKVGVVCE